MLGRLAKFYSKDRGFNRKNGTFLKIDRASAPNYKVFK
jgi:hypothetical protein